MLIFRVFESSVDAKRHERLCFCSAFNCLHKLLPSLEALPSPVPLPLRSTPPPPNFFCPGLAGPLDPNQSHADLTIPEPRSSPVLHEICPACDVSVVTCTCVRVVSPYSGAVYEQWRVLLGVVHGGIVTLGAGRSRAGKISENVATWAGGVQRVI